MAYTKISITGDLGSGKSTIAKLLTQKIDCRLYSTGNIQRELAKKLNMTTMELNKYMEENSSIDDDIDDFNKNLNIKNESFIIDSRMAWHFIPASFKIFLNVDPTISASRVFNDNNRKSERYNNVDDARNELMRREESENKRFRDLYDVNCSDMDNYDLVVDTSYSDPESIVDKILKLHKRWLENRKLIKFWAHSRLLFPTQPISRLGRPSSKQIYDSVRTNGFNPEFPIQVFSSNNFHFIFDGHLRVSASIFADVNLIPLNYIATDISGLIFGVRPSKFATTEFKIGYAYDWEECHKFTYPSYPDFLSNK